MAGISKSSSLRLWSLATFHVATFVTSLVIAFHLSGDLSGILSGLNTATGFASFLFLWMTTWFATRTGLRRMRLHELDETALQSVVPPTLVAGGWNGVYVWGALLVGLILISFRELGSSVLFLLASGLTIGSLLAFTIGSVVGLLYGFLDGILLRLGAILFHWAETSEDSDLRMGGA